jgi:hypothetical protein
MWWFTLSLLVAITLGLGGAIAWEYREHPDDD